jgi:osmotically inducible protein OsmC
MALTLNLEKTGSPPEHVRTTADVTLELSAAGASITKIALATEAKVPGLDAAKFQEIADQTKKGCPVSKALAAVPISLEARLA